MSSEKEYILGTHDEELLRLAFQHRVWGAQTFALWERAGFRAGSTILDVGCGPGFAAMDLARLVRPHGRVIALDESARFLEYLALHARSQGLENITTMQGDAQRVSLPAESVDAAYCRWVLCFVPRPEDVVAGVVTALRSGGVFAIQDYFNYRALALAPRSPILEKVAQATDSSWRTRGGDPDIAARLPEMLSRAGCEVREIRPQLRVARPGEMLWEWPTTFFLKYLPTLVELGLLSPGEQREFEAEWAARSKDPNTFFSTPPVYEIIAVKK